MRYFGNQLFSVTLNWNHMFCCEELLLFHCLHTVNKCLKHSFLWAKLKRKSLATLYRKQASSGPACWLLRAPEGSRRAELCPGPRPTTTGEKVLCLHSWMLCRCHGSSSANPQDTRLAGGLPGQMGLSTYKIRTWMLQQIILDCSVWWEL